MTPGLGEFRTPFAGVLGSVEERPTDADDDMASFAGALDVVGTDDMLRKAERDPSVRPDARAFLEARLMDLFLGDWDRHRDQWRWALMSRDGARRWVPVPRDRDQAFAKYDGFVLDLVRYSFPQLLEFSRSYANPVGATWNGRDLDRRLLTGLERPVWDSVAAELTARLTDAVIGRAVSALPPEYPVSHGRTWPRPCAPGGMA